MKIENTTHIGSCGLWYQGFELKIISRVRMGKIVIIDVFSIKAPFYKDAIEFTSNPNNKLIIYIYVL